MKKTIGVTVIILALAFVLTACKSVNEEVRVNPFPARFTAHGNNYSIDGYRIYEFEVHVFGNFQKLPMKMSGSNYEILNLMTCFVITHDGTEYKADVTWATNDALGIEFSSSISNVETIRLHNGDSGDEIMSFRVADVPQTSSEPEAVSSAEDMGAHYEGSIIGSWEYAGSSANGEVWLKIFITPNGRFKFESADGLEEGAFKLMGNNANIEGDDTEQVVLVKQGILISYPEDGGGETFWRFEIEDDVLTLGDNNYKRVE